MAARSLFSHAIAREAQMLRARQVEFQLIEMEKRPTVFSLSTVFMFYSNIEVLS